MATVYVGVGSNIDPERNIPDAMRALRSRARITGVSAFYRTPPLGAPGDPEFFNGVVRIETDLEPSELRADVLRRIEDDLGRRRTSDPNSPRPIDLDIILYEERVSREGGIIIPAPDIRTRAFVAVPLLELAPDLVLPDDGARLKDLVRSMDRRGLAPLPEFSETLIKEFGNESGTSQAAGPRAAG